MKKGFAKCIYCSSDGTHALQLHGSKKLLVFDAEKASKISGLDDYLSSWLSNSCRVFTPVEYSVFRKKIEIVFTAENITVVVERVDNIPKMLLDNDKEYSLEE